jgi:hypothetical protein
MKICTYNFLDSDKTSINLSKEFWELPYVIQLDALQDIAADAMKVYKDHLARWGTEDEGKKYKPKIDL